MSHDGDLSDTMIPLNQELRASRDLMQAAESAARALYDPEDIGRTLPGWFTALRASQARVDGMTQHLMSVASHDNLLDRLHHHYDCGISPCPYSYPTCKSNPAGVCSSCLTPYSDGHACYWDAQGAIKVTKEVLDTAKAAWEASDKTGSFYTSEACRMQRALNSKV